MRVIIISTILLSTIFFSTITSTFSLTSDGLILLSFKYSILDDPLHVLDTWSYSDATPCLWRGITCNYTTFNYFTQSGTPRVTEVSLSGCNLLGSLPIDFGLLDHLQVLNMSSNSLNGSIPDSLFSLPELRLLDLSNNSISGDLPESIGGLRSLEILDVSENALGGNIPRNLGTLMNLTWVSLKGNYFSGSFPGGFDRVGLIDFSSNLLNGSLPVDFGGESIQTLNISYNRISGEISPVFGNKIPENATLDFSYNNLTGEIPNSNVFLSQERDSFAGNRDLCGPPLSNPCSIPSSPTSLPPDSNQPIPPPAIAAIPKSFPTSEGPKPGPKEKAHGLRPHVIAAIVVGDLTAIAILAMIFLFVCKRNPKTSPTNNNNNNKGHVVTSSTSRSSSSSESKGITKWSCLTKGKHIDDEDEDDEDDEDDDDVECGSNNERPREQMQQQGQLVTVDTITGGGSERVLEIETLLKASAYILGASGTSIMYKAVLEDGTVLAVRRVGESNSVEKLKDFEGHVRAIAKFVHPNLVKVRGFYWGSDEKLIIYEYVSNGNLANARYYKKTGSSPCRIPWSVRLKIAIGVARGLSYIHEKKHVHGNLKPNNILLDSDMQPKISDFGLERLTTGKFGYIPGGSTRHFGSKRSTTSKDSFQEYVGATPSPSGSSIGCISPYHPPESLRSLKPNSKWDVYSFGVVLLELITGKVVVSDELGPPVLAELAVGLDDRVRMVRMADPTIRADLEGKEEELLTCLKLGYNCISHVPQKRPSMKEILHVLEKITTSPSTQ